MLGLEDMYLVRLESMSFFILLVMNLPAKPAHGEDPILRLIHRCEEPGCDGLMGNARIHEGSNNPVHRGKICQMVCHSLNVVFLIFC
jgi:hypothetical protein